MARTSNPTVMATFKEPKVVASQDIVTENPQADEVNRNFRGSSENHAVTFEWLTFEDMTIDPRVQRPANLPEQRNIAKNFNPAALGTHTLSRRVAADGTVTNVLLDGQQRRGGSILAGYNEKVRCLVHHELTLPEEAQLFLDLNFRRAVPATTTYQVQLVAGHESALALELILDGVGIRSCIAGGFQAVQTGRKLVERTNGVANLTWALQQVKAIYDQGEGGVYDGIVVEAFWRLYDRYNVNTNKVNGIRGLIDVDTLRKNLASFPNGITGLLAAAATVKQSGERGMASDHVAQAISLRYNKGKPANSKTALPNWTREKKTTTKAVEDVVVLAEAQEVPARQE